MIYPEIGRNINILSKQVVNNKHVSSFKLFRLVSNENLQYTLIIQNF